MFRKAFSIALWSCVLTFTTGATQSTYISRAMLDARRGDTVWLDSGVYRERVHVEFGVVLASRVPGAAILDGEGKGTVVTLSGGAQVIGLEIRNGGIGVFSRGKDNSILGCRIVKNWGTGIMCVGHLPKIEDNVIAFNQGSGVQGWGIRSTVHGSIRHNTIAYNANHGIALGGTSEISVRNNILAFNELFGIKSVGDARAVVVSNVIFGNTGDAGLAISRGNFAFDPLFVSARTLDFALATGSPCRERAEDGTDIGSRARFVTQ